MNEDGHKCLHACVSVGSLLYSQPAHKLMLMLLMLMYILCMICSTSSGGCGLLWAVLAYCWLIRKGPSQPALVSSKLSSATDQNSNINAATPVPWLTLFTNYSFW